MKITLRPIVPKRPIFDTARFETLSARAIQDSKDGILNDFKKTVSTWTHKPRFYVTRRGFDWYIGTNDEIYGYVDNGTVPHVIRPKSPRGRLRFFRSGFRAKSRVNYIASYMGQKASKDLTFAKIVHHPGTKARNFSLKISEKWQKEFARQIRAAVKAASGG